MSVVLDWMWGCVGAMMTVMRWCRMCVVQLLNMDQLIIGKVCRGMYCLNK